MSEYVRATQVCSVDQLHPELLHAIQDYFQEHGLGDLEAETIICCETVSRKKQAGRLISWLNGSSPDAIIHTGMLLTSRWLIWVHHGDHTGTLLNAADLKFIRAGFYSPLFPKDAGLEIVGLIGEAKERVRGYVGMGPDPDTHKFCEAVSQAITEANPPTRRGLFGLLRG